VCVELFKGHYVEFYSIEERDFDNESGGVYIKSKLPDMHLLPPYCVFDFLYLGTRCDQNDTNDQYCLCHLRLVPFVVITMYIVVERSKVNPIRNK